MLRRPRLLLLLLLLALAALLGPLLPAPTATADPATAPDPVGALEAALDEFELYVSRLSRAAAAGAADEAARAEGWAPGERLEANRRGLEELGAELTGLTAGERSEEAPPGGAAYYAATTAVNLRAAPANAAAVLTVLREGAVVRGTARDRGWLRVEYTDRFARGFSGWVHGNFLRRVDAPPPRGGA